MPRPEKYDVYIWVTCPTCRGKKTKGFDKNGPKPCPLCNSVTVQVGRRVYRARPGKVPVPKEPSDR